KNQEYDTKLIKLADWYCCEPKLMEYIVWKYHGHASEQKKSYWLAAMKQYPEIKVLIEGGTVVLDGEAPGGDYMNLAFDEHFESRIRKFKRIQAMNRQIDGYAIGDVAMSIYEVMTTFRSYIPKDVKYYKGLGELTVDEMWELCLDPEKRTGIVLKFKNYEDDMRKLSIILSGRKEYSDLRMEILSSIALSEDDLAT
ncbi:MAG: hypothetical protein K2F99_00195, partial [Muribaculaceae bacterium]|nr:hypothetical protein [Muribaculaceae bacterium]